jgi:hypothetical protein
VGCERELDFASGRIELEERNNQLVGRIYLSVYEFFVNFDELFLGISEDSSYLYRRMFKQGLIRNIKQHHHEEPFHTGSRLVPRIWSKRKQR